jgi:hypothetical protein
VTLAVVARVEHDVAPLFEVTVDDLVDEKLQRLEGLTLFADHPSGIFAGHVEYDLLVVLAHLHANVELHAVENRLRDPARVVGLVVVFRASGRARLALALVRRFALFVDEQRSIHVVSTLVHVLSSQEMPSLLQHLMASPTHRP